MLNMLKKFILVIVLFQVMTFGAESKSQENTGSLLHYRCQITVKYMQLSELSDVFGTILILENYENIFLASNAVVDAFDEIKHELEVMDIPQQMVDPFNLFLKSTELYMNSTYYIHIAMGITLRRYNGSMIEVQQLFDLAEDRLDTANTYLGQSIDLHEKLFEDNKIDSYECNKQVAGVY